jgi:hypothetical protein
LSFVNLTNPSDAVFADSQGIGSISTTIAGTFVAVCKPPSGRRRWIRGGDSTKAAAAVEEILGGAAVRIAVLSLGSQPSHG